MLGPKSPDHRSKKKHVDPAIRHTHSQVKCSYWSVKLFEKTDSVARELPINRRSVCVCLWWPSSWIMVSNNSQHLLTNRNEKSNEILHVFIYNLFAPVNVKWLKIKAIKVLIFLMCTDFFKNAPRETILNWQKCDTALNPWHTFCS